MTVSSGNPVAGPQPDRPDFFAIVDRLLIGQIPAGGACTQMTVLERRLLMPVWDGDSEKPSLAERAQKICLSCPLLESCRRYATDNLIEHGFLAGLTAVQRRASWTKHDRITWRRRKTRVLYEAGATVAEMVEVLAIPRRTIEADIAALGLSGSRRRNRAA